MTRRAVGDAPARWFRRLRRTPGPPPVGLGAIVTRRPTTRARLARVEDELRWLRLGVEAWAAETRELRRHLTMSDAPSQPETGPGGDEGGLEAPPTPTPVPGPLAPDPDDPDDPDAEAAGGEAGAG